MFDMARDSEYFHSIDQLNELGAKPMESTNPGGLWHKKNDTYVPLYEGKMIWYYDHRYNSVLRSTGQQGSGRETTLGEHKNPFYSVVPRYWVNRKEVIKRKPEDYAYDWYISFRDITNAVDRRTFTTTIIPNYGAGHTLPLIITRTDVKYLNLLLANLSSLVFDYITRHKITGTHMSFYYIEQFPIFNIEDYNESLINIINNKIIKLIYTSHDLGSYAKNYGPYEGPFKWDIKERDQIKAEIDAIYAYLYKLDKNNLTHILDHFKVLKRNEINLYGEYQTKRLVLDAYDRLGPQLEEMLNE